MRRSLPWAGGGADWKRCSERRPTPVRQIRSMRQLSVAVCRRAAPHRRATPHHRARRAAAVGGGAAGVGGTRTAVATTTIITITIATTTAEKTRTSCNRSRCLWSTTSTRRGGRWRRHAAARVRALPCSSRTNSHKMAKRNSRNSRKHTIDRWLWTGRSRTQRRSPPRLAANTQVDAALRAALASQLQTVPPAPANTMRDDEIGAMASQIERLKVSRKAQHTDTTAC